MKKLIQYKSIPILLTFVFLWGCSTKKNTFVTRNFHELTSHYNVYFNGNEAYTNSLESALEELGDDYTKILPIYIENQPQVQKKVSGDMDYAVEKATKLIKYHSITVPPDNRKKKNKKKRQQAKSEYNKWVDDAYILMGKAYLAKGDYVHANGTFSTMLRKFKDDPIKYDAFVWLIRTLTQSERYSEARSIIETLEGDDVFPAELEGELAIAAADLALKQDKYEDAIQYLNIGINNIKGNDRITRYTYILAQLYQETGKKGQALDAYNEVIRRRPDYEMRFNAQINGASVYSGEGSGLALRKELLKMSKKVRNKNYLDQIYYALGNLSFGENNLKEAISYYKRSAVYAEKNVYQRTLSCLTLAEIYFDEKEYVPSGMYYDSAMIVMDEYYPNYEEISAQYKSLNNLVTNLITVQTQDSLQHLASLSSQELNQKINGWVEKAKIKQEQEAQALVYAANVRSSNRRSNNRSTFYFYNASTVAYGKKEFLKKWGNRKLADNWRRSNKATQIIEDAPEGEMEESLADAVDKNKVEELRIDDPTNPKYYRQDIPVNDSMLLASDHMIRDGLYNAGMIFRTDFNDLERSIECFLDLNNRFPDNIYIVSAYFNLYDLYKTTNQPDSAKFYKELIINNYPETNFAKFLNNPNYFIEQEVQKDSLLKIYHQSLVAYRNHNLPMAASLSAKALELSPDSTLKSKVEFINLVSSNSEKPTEELITRLNNYKEEYPNEPLNEVIDQIIKLANEKQLTNYQDLVRNGYLNDIIQNPELAEEFGDEEMDAKWDTEEDLFHYFVIALPNDESIDLNRLKFDIANYNIDHYMTRDFEIETEKLNPETQLLIVRNLDNKESGLIYFLSIIRKPEVFKTLAAYQYLNFIISNNNFRQMKEDASYDNYIQFFIQNYSNFTKGLFDESDLESPEELIARLKKEDEIQEKGEFVVVETEKKSESTNYDPIFNKDFAEEHLVILLIDQANYRTAFINRGFMMFNNTNYRDARLRTSTDNLKNHTALLVSKFNNARLADDYIQKADGNRNIFGTLNDIKYNFISISTQNYNLLKQNNEVENYLNFYKNSYNNIPAIIEKKQKVLTNTQQVENTQPQNGASKTSNETHSADAQQIPQNEETIEETAPEPEIEIYVEDKNVPHKVLFVIPAQGVNTALLTMYINRYVSLSFSGLSLEVSTKDFNSVKKTVIVSGFANAELAKEFYDGIASDKRVTLALRAVEYTRLVISDANLTKMTEQNDLSGYQSFFENNY